MQLKGKSKTAVERVVELAMRLGGKHLADYGAARSRHDFTQRQLMACLILRAYLKTTYRGVLELLAVSPKLREALGMQDKLPHYTTLQKFSARSQVLAIADAMIRTIGRAAGEPEFARGSGAMDATGMETTTASAHFQSRAGRTRRKWVKVSTNVLCGSLLPLSLVLDWGPGNDKCQASELMNKASAATLPAKLYADAGYDAEWVHDQCRLEWGAESVIKPAKQRADGTRGGFWRSQMSERYLKRKGYGSRWAVESFFSGLKRTMGSTLTSRKPSQLAGRSRLQGAGLHPPALGDTNASRCFQQSSMKTIYIEPCSPWQNGFAESFHARFRDECLNREQLWTLTEARVVVGDFRQKYNQVKPHSRLGYEIPVAFAARIGPFPSPVGLRPPCAGNGQTEQNQTTSTKSPDYNTKWLRKVNPVTSAKTRRTPFRRACPRGR